MRTFFVLLMVIVSAFAAEAKDQPWTVTDAVQAARDHHPAKVQAKSILEEAKGARRASLSLDSPSFSVEYEGVPEGAGLDAYEERRLAVSQEIDFPLRYIWYARQQNALVDAAEFQQQLILLELEQEVRLAYLEVWYADEQLARLERYASSLDTQAISFQQMRNVGRIAELDVYRANAEAAEAQSDLGVKSAEWMAARTWLANMTGRAELPSKLVSPMEVDWITPLSESGWTDNLNLLGAREVADAAKEGQILAATSWLPTIEVGGFRQKVPNALDGSDFWGLEVGLSIPIWYLWGGVGEIEVAAAQERSAWANVEIRQLELKTEWQAAIAQLQAEQERVKTFEQFLIPTSESILRLAHRSYETGKASYLDVLEAQRSMLQRQLDYLDSIYDLERIRITLDQLAGRSILTTNSVPMER